MEFQRGERQSNRTKTAIMSAFSQLIREKNFSEITINEIIEHANTGRSTFYRYFQTKSDLLVEMHQGIFRNLIPGLSSKNVWLSDDPHPPLVAFLQQYQKMRSAPTGIVYRLNSDIEYVMRSINTLLPALFEESLRCSFSEKDLSIPFSVLTQSIAGMYGWLIMSWFMNGSQIPAEQIARHIHRLTRAMILEALEL